MRILFITDKPVTGIQSVHVRELSDNLASMGHTVIINAGYEDKKILPDLPARVSFNSLGSFYSGNNLTRRALGRLRMRLLSLIHGLKGMSSFDIIYCRAPVAFDALILKMVTGKPLVYELNDLATFAREFGYNRVVASLTEFGERQLVHRSNKVVAMTQGVKSYLVENYHVPNSKVVVIGNGANTDLFQPMDMAAARAKSGLKADGHFIGFIGTFAPLLGLEHLVECAPMVLEHHPEAKFLLVGGGPLGTHIRELVAQKNLNHAFIFAGPVPYHKVPEYINACDITATHISETRVKELGMSPLRIYESMACGRPVVTGDHPGLRECIGDTGAGILVLLDDPVELAKAIIKLLGDKSLREKMGRRGREAAVNQYSWKQTAQRVAQVCESVLA